jgi:hypothetical protein
LHRVGRATLDHPATAADNARDSRGIGSRPFSGAGGEVVQMGLSQSSRRGPALAAVAGMAALCAVVLPFASAEPAPAAVATAQAYDWRLGGTWFDAGARLVMLGTSGGACHDVAVLGNRAYVASGLGVLVFDTTNPTMPEPIASWPLTSSSLSMATDGRLIYVGTTKSGLYVFDPSQPAAPRLVYSTLWGQLVDAMVQRGDYLFLAMHVQVAGIVVLRVSGAVPEYVRGLNLRGQVAGGIALEGDYAYVATTAGLEVANLTDPEKPSWLAKVDLGASGLDVVVWGQRAYVLTGSQAGSGIAVVDISKPDQPGLLGQSPLAAWGYCIRLVGGHLFVATDKGLQVFDLSNPDSPASVGHYDSTSPALGARQLGTSLYVTEAGPAWNGTEVVDISAPENPHRVGFFETGAQGADVRLAGRYAYLATPYGVQVLDMADPKLPRVAGRYEAHGGAVRRLYLVGNLAYLATTGGLEIASVAQPVPSFVGLCAANGPVLGISPGTPSRISLATTWGVETCDASLPAAPKLLADHSQQTYGQAWDVAGYYPSHTALTTTGMWDFYHPRPPNDPIGPAGYCFAQGTRFVSKGGIIPSAFPMWAVSWLGHGILRVRGTWAYLMGDYGLMVCDVTDPAHPRGAASCQMYGEFAPGYADDPSVGYPNYLQGVDASDLYACPSPGQGVVTADLGKFSPTPPTPVRGDMDGNGVVTDADLAHFIQVWIAHLTQAAFDALCDLYPVGAPDGQLTWDDAAEMLSLWLAGQ